MYDIGFMILVLCWLHSARGPLDYASVEVLCANVYPKLGSDAFEILSFFRWVGSMHCTCTVFRACYPFYVECIPLGDHSFTLL